MKETKNIDTENTVVTDTVKETSERGVKLTQPIERGGEKITYEPPRKSWRLNSLRKR
ncbi:phage tail protein [Escherichia coli]|nr:phage tail protein [Escherichia coli]